MELSLTKTTTP
ncbi:unnamed protein product, partial [Rotaria sordida]